MFKRWEARVSALHRRHKFRQALRSGRQRREATAAVAHLRSDLEVESSPAWTPGQTRGGLEKNLRKTEQL
ncbi:hypothetical protein AAFF_G00274710 [Aldrovandia affinis]|uniref:Uncharacterized protein n=1 Tax=Aldrovandia affinis TaxID=143900 RepID=A0AAD7SRQ4_9TELE|nr:hypothetical protein AAFF_G00274710 [Aldrovandia affinis]